MAFQEMMEKTWDLIVAGGGLTGVAAALAVKGGVGVKEIDVKELQRVLTENGAFIG